MIGCRIERQSVKKNMHTGSQHCREISQKHLHHGGPCDLIGVDVCTTRDKSKVSSFVCAQKLHQVTFFTGLFYENLNLSHPLQEL